MGLISRVSSRTYRNSTANFPKKSKHAYQQRKTRRHASQRTTNQNWRHATKQSSQKTTIQRRRLRRQKDRSHPQKVLLLHPSRHRRSKHVQGRRKRYPLQNPKGHRFPNLQHFHRFRPGPSQKDHRDSRCFEPVGLGGFTRLATVGQESRTW